MSIHHKTGESVRYRVLALVAGVVIAAGSAVRAQVPKQPASRVDNFREVMHSVEIVDPYRWLEDQEHPETRAWIDAQNKYTHSLLDDLPSRPLIQKRLSELLRVGAALTQRPDLFQAVLCEFPDLDMIGYYRFKNNNPPALLEYGNASDPAQFKYLYAYSPYQKVKPGEKYPAVLFTTGDQDTRVPPLQARKMTARGKPRARQAGRCYCSTTLRQVTPVDVP